MSFPTELSEITVEWLNEVMIRNGILDTERILDLKHEDVPKQGGTSLTYILTLSYDRRPDHAPQKLLVKLTTDNKNLRDVVGSYDGFQREVHFYETVGSDAGIPIPRCYASGYNADDHSCLLLMDYIDNTCLRDVGDGPVSDIELAVRKLACFHAKWWRKTDRLFGVYHEDDPFLLEPRISRTTDALELMRRRYRKDVGNTIVTLLDLWLRSARLLADYTMSLPQTLCHGDFHRRQLLLPVAEGDPFCVIDWQSVSIDFGPSDLARIILTGLLPGQRKENERTLLTLYHALLLQHGVTDYSFEQFLDQYRLGIIRQAVIHAQLLVMMNVADSLEWWATEGPKGTGMWELLYHWPSQAVEEHDVIPYLETLVQGQ